MLGEESWHHTRISRKKSRYVRLRYRGPQALQDRHRQQAAQQEIASFQGCLRFPILAWRI